MLYVVDRIEENIAVLVCDDDGSTSEIELSYLHEGACDGDVVRKTDVGYVFEKKLTADRKNSISSRFDRLKKKMSQRKGDQK